MDRSEQNRFLLSLPLPGRDLCPLRGDGGLLVPRGKSSKSTLKGAGPLKDPPNYGGNYFALRSGRLSVLRGALGRQEAKRLRIRPIVRRSSGVVQYENAQRRLLS